MLVWRAEGQWKGCVGSMNTPHPHLDSGGVWWG